MQIRAISPLGGLRRRASLVLAALPATAAHAQALPRCKNPALTASQRAQDLMACITLEEKVAQMQSIWVGTVK